MNQTAITRLESYQQTKPTISQRQQEIIDQLKIRQPLTSWELSDILNRPVYQVRPRLTELEKLGKVRTGGTKFQERTGRKESLYWVVTLGQMELI